MLEYTKSTCYLYNKYACWHSCCVILVSCLEIEGVVCIHAFNILTYIVQSRNIPVRNNKRHIIWMSQCRRCIFDSRMRLRYLSTWQYNYITCTSLMLWNNIASQLVLLTFQTPCVLGRMEQTKAYWNDIGMREKIDWFYLNNSIDYG